MSFSSKLQKTAVIVSGLGFALGAVWAFIALARAFWDAFAQLNPAVEAGIVAGAATILVSVVSVLFSKHLEQKLIIRKEHREKKIPVYEELINFIFRVLYAQKEGQSQISEKELIETYSRLTQNAIIWASDDVVRALHRFRVASLTGSENFLPLALAVEDLFFAIRRDLGHKNKDISSGQLLGMVINDLNKIVRS